MSSFVKLLLSILVVAMFYHNAFCDESMKFLHPICISEVGYFDVSTISIPNDEPDLRGKAVASALKKKYSLLSSDQLGEFSCNLDGKKVVMHYSLAMSGGLCGREGGTHILVDLSVNNIQLLRGIVMADDCYEANVRRISLNRYGFDFEALSKAGLSEPPRYFSFFALINQDKVIDLGPIAQSLPITMPMVEKRITNLDR